ATCREAGSARQCRRQRVGPHDHPAGIASLAGGLRRTHPVQEGGEVMSNSLFERAKNLGLYGLIARWETFGAAPWLAELIENEEAERAQRSLDRRIKHAKLGSFKSMADFDYLWPEGLDREMLDELFTFGFLGEAANVVIVG